MYNDLFPSYAVNGEMGAAQYYCSILMLLTFSLLKLTNHLIPTFGVLIILIPVIIGGL